MKIAMNWLRNPVFYILSLIVLFHAILLLPELTALSPDLNDNVFHYDLCVSMQEELETGGNLIDHWVPYWSMGYPVFHHYQHFPHLLVVFIFNIFYGQVPLILIFRFFNYILLVLYPLVLYYSLRKMRLPRIAAAGAALFSLTLSNLNGYGLELGAFIWRGSGMFSQLWAMFLFPLTLSSIYRALAEDKEYFWSAVFLFLLANSQVMFGLMAAITALIFLFMDLNAKQIWARTRKLLFIFGIFFIFISYLLIPMMLDSPYHAHSSYDFAEKWGSYGAKYVIVNFFGGKLLDSGRLAVVTFLTIIGLLYSFARREFIYRLAGIGFLLWFLLYFGRPTWGRLFDLIPMGSALHLHRLITMVDFFSIILVGVGSSVVYEFVKTRYRQGLALAAILLLILPVFWDRFDFITHNNEWLIDNRKAYDAEKKDLAWALNAIKRAPPGRVYPGRRGNWGKDFKIGQTPVLFFLGQEKIPALSFLPFSWALAGDFSTSFNEWRWSHYNLFNIKYVLSDDVRTFPGFAKLKTQVGRFRLREVWTTGYFDLVDSPMAIYADKNSLWNLTLMWLRSSWMDRKQYVSIYFDRKYRPGYRTSLLFEDRWKYSIFNPSSSPTELLDVFTAAKYFDENPGSTTEPGKVLEEWPKKNVFSGKVRADKDCFLLFKMTYHPGWHAYIDGKEVETIIMTPGFVGVKIAKGVHGVKFEYRAPRWKTPLIIVGLFAAIMLYRWEKQRK